MAHDNIVQQVLELSQQHELKWYNYKDQQPRHELSQIDYNRVRLATNYPKEVLPVKDGYNKYQSYYAFKDKLIIVLTKNKRDDSLVLVLGEVNYQGTDQKPRPHHRKTKLD